jgi:hypothetical protein
MLLEVAKFQLWFHVGYIYIIYTYDGWSKFLYPRNGHSSRIKMLLSRNFRKLHVDLSRNLCWWFIISNFRETSAKENVTFANSKKRTYRSITILCIYICVCVLTPTSRLQTVLRAWSFKHSKEIVCLGCCLVFYRDDAHKKSAWPKATTFSYFH